MAIALAVVAVVAVVVAAARTSRREGPPFDPRSTSPDGARAMVLLAERFGLAVEGRAGGVGPQDAVALVLADELTDRDRDRLLAWARSGGSLVVADVRSPLLGDRTAGSVAATATRPAVHRGRCTAGFVGVDEVVGLIATYDARAGERTCFGDGARAGVVAVPMGSGTLVAVGGPGPFTNAELGLADNAAFVADVLGVANARPGQGGASQGGSPVVRVGLVGRSPVGQGEHTLADLVPRGVRLALGQLGLAFVVLVWAVAPRLGAPVVEPNLRDLPASALTGAVAELYHRGHRRDVAARLLRRRLRRALARRTGLSLDGPAELLIPAAPRQETAEGGERQGPPDSAAAGPDATAPPYATAGSAWRNRAGYANADAPADSADFANWDAEAGRGVRWLLDDLPVGSDAELVELARATEAAQRETPAAGPRIPPAPPGSAEGSTT